MCRHNPGIYQVYTRLRNCRLGKDILGISQSYSFYLKKHGTGHGIMIYQVYIIVPGLGLAAAAGESARDMKIVVTHMTWYIPGISQGYDIHGHKPGIYQVYTTKFPSMGPGPARRAGIGSSRSSDVASETRSPRRLEQLEHSARCRSVTGAGASGRAPAASAGQALRPT